MEKTSSLRSSAKKRTAGVLVGIAIGLASVGVVTPANAAEWAVVSSRTYCNTISGWSDCYKETTWKRTALVCAKPAGSFTGGLAAWYSYCYKTTKVRL